MAIRPITALKNGANRVFKSIDRKFRTAQRKLRDADNKMKRALRKCQGAKNSLMRKKRSCPREEMLYTREEITREEKLYEQLGENAKTGLWRRRRRGRGFFGGIAHGIKRAAQKAAGAVCRAALSGLAHLVNAACQAPIHVARGFLRAAQLALRGLQAIVNKARAFINQVLKLVLDALKFLTQVQVRSIGFKMQSVKPSVTLSAKFLIARKPRKFSFTFGMSGGSLGKLVGSIFKNVFEAIKKAALKTLNNIKKKLTSLFEEAEEVERQAEEMRQQAIREGQEMERQYREATKEEVDEDL